MTTKKPKKSPMTDMQRVDAGFARWLRNRAKAQHTTVCGFTRRLLRNLQRHPEVWVK